MQQWHLVGRGRLRGRQSFPSPHEIARFLVSARNEAKRAYWQEVLRRGEASGLSVREFCREQRVSEASYYSWKRKLASGGGPAGAAAAHGDRKPPKSRLVSAATRRTTANAEHGGAKPATKDSAAKPARVLQACRTDTRDDSTAVFIPVRVKAATDSLPGVVSPRGSLLEVVHPRGYVVRVPAVFDEGSLRRVLDVLDRSGDA